MFSHVKNCCCFSFQRICFLGTLFIGLVSVSCLSATDDWRSYRFYEPEITRGLVVDTANNPFDNMYNHDSSMAWFDGHWVAVWNSGLDREGWGGQINVMALSEDAINWTAAEIAFSTPERSVNPILDDPLDETVQWQPNLVVVGEQLWCFWSILDFLNGIDRLKSRGVYFSTLDSVHGKWTNRLLRWEIDPATGRAVSRPDTDGPETTPVNGRPTLLFPSQNAIEVKSGRYAGRVMAPVTTRGAGERPGLRENGVIYSDDGGITWHMSEPILFDQSPLLWEPTVYEIGPDHIAMVARCRGIETITDPAKILTFNESFDGGVTWSPTEWIPVETISSRMHVVPANGRFAMIYNDHRHEDHAGDRDSDRVNLALFFSRSGRIADWLPANSVSRPNQYGVTYAQMEAKDNGLYIIYSDGFSRSLHTAILDPLPSVEGRYIFPRGLEQPRPETSGGAIHFEFGQSLETAAINEPGQGDLSITARLISKHGGTLVDGLSEDGKEGFLFYLHRESSNWHIHYPALYLPGQGHFICAEGIPAEKEAYIGFSLRNGREVTFTVNANNRRSHTTGYAFPLNDVQHLDSGRTYRFGIQHPRSGPPTRNFRGDLFEVGIDNRALTLAEHQERRRCGQGSKPRIHLTADTLDSADFVLPPFVGVAPCSEEPGSYAIHGYGSAALELDLPEASTATSMQYTFDFKAANPTQPLVLFTAGDPESPLRLELLPSGEIQLRQGADSQTVTRNRPGQWTHVEIALSLDGSGSTVRLGGQTARTTAPVGPRAYLGQGYREAADTLTGDQFHIRRDSVRYRVR